MDKPDAIIIDLEGTLSDHSARVHHLYNKQYSSYNAGFLADPVNINFVKILASFDSKIILCTAKEQRYNDDVTEWLRKHNLLNLIDGAYYRENMDQRSSVEVKKDMLVRLEKKYNIIRAFDDREDICKMFRNNGVPATLVGGKSNSSKPAEQLRESADLFESKNKEYGNGYKEFGKIMMEFFPDGIEVKNQKDASRFAMLNIIIAKLDRYCKNFHKGGHADSLVDISVYSAMLKELDDEYNNL